MRFEYQGRVVGTATGGVSLEGDGAVVVLVHGAGMDRTVWQLQTRWLAHRGYRAVAVDLPGHGNSEGPACESIEAAAEWLAGWIEAVGLAPANLVGHSMGTFVAIEVAARRPDLVDSLLLLGTADTMSVHPALLDAATDDRPLAGKLISGWALSGTARLGSNPTPGMWMVGGTRALLDRSAEGVLATDLTACNAYDRASGLAGSVRCPVRLVLGASDRMTPARSGSALAEMFPAADAFVLDGAGHQLMTERPSDVCRLIADAIG